MRLTRYVIGFGLVHRALPPIWTARGCSLVGSRDVRAAALLLAGAEDRYVPLTQLTDQMNTLAAARSVTARVFTRDERAQNCVQAGSIALSVQVMLDWLDSMRRRDS